MRQTARKEIAFHGEQHMQWLGAVLRVPIMPLEWVGMTITVYSKIKPLGQHHTAWYVVGLKLKYWSLWGYVQFHHHRSPPTNFPACFLLVRREMSSQRAKNCTSWAWIIINPNKWYWSIQSWLLRLFSEMQAGDPRVSQSTHQKGTLRSTKASLAQCSVPL